MIEILNLKDEDTIAFRVDGKVEKADIERAFKEPPTKSLCRAM